MDRTQPDRRRLDRTSLAPQQVTVPVIVARGPEEPGPPGDLIDLSHNGLLVRLAASGRPPGVGERVLLSLSLADGMLHVLGRAVRCVRGEDGLWYVAAAFDEVELLDRCRLDRLLEPLDHQPAGPLEDCSFAR